ncbi:hypothetical protein [Allosphingosinicella flava]|uniref:hypothetical protein n=1 Tax=Allosphingosinicella flava TaxID=2771430 RepID=UPI001A9C7420|nr:hypothetical protein [Sphingosinicella flava]
MLDRSLLEFQLNSITTRNETHDFEVFCRHLCQRTICPNLRPQTGPEGGGDSKADADTVPVADEIATLTYVGEANAGREKWAFAFSAKATWSEKVRKDVAGIVATGRGYDRIFCVTSRPARAKDRARIEKELTDKYAAPVTILDRSWIVKEVIENDRKDLAFNYLGVGQMTNDPLHLGPEDYSRIQQLAAIERAIDDPAAFAGMEGQRVTEALVAAKLSRNLERPRVDTDGRFVRAIRLADQDGTYRQQLEARYEHLWTSYFWFDDIGLLNRDYSNFEKFALKTNHARNLEFLVNLLQLQFNSVIHRHLSREQAQLDHRIATLKAALEMMAADEDRPNNRLEARTSLAIIQMNLAKVDGKAADLPAVWREFSSILDAAKGMGEFGAKRLIQLVEIAGGIAGNDPDYNNLIEKLADFVATRTSEAQAALILLKRAQQLGFADKFDMIRWLGKAAAKLTKREHNEQLIEAQQLLTLAYRSAGLLWAARATCLFVAASIIIEGEEKSELPVSFVPTMKLLAWLSLELGILPDFLLAIQLLNGALATLPLDEESQEKVKKDIFALDLALGCRLLNATDEELKKLKFLPDLLEALGLFMARGALLYTSGYKDLLREDGSIPPEESDEGAERQMALLASQPIAQQVSDRILLNSGDVQVASTTVLGMTVEVTSATTNLSLLIAQTVLGSLEAFFATVIEQRAAPHTERFLIRIVEVGGDVPSFDVDVMKMRGTVGWPRTLSPSRFPQQESVQHFLMELTGKVLASAFIINDVTSLLDSLYVDEEVQGRMAMILAACTSYHRIAGRDVSRPENWQNRIRSTYPPRPPRPQLERIDFPVSPDEDDEEDTSDDDGIGRPRPRNHRQMGVRSVIDLHAWNQAKWKGAGYLQFQPDYPPALVLLFENREGAINIFERWRERFGIVDEREEVRLAIIRNIFPEHPAHYAVQVSSRLPTTEEVKVDQPFVTATRSLVMEPETDTNLQMFLSAYQKIGAYYLMPGILNGPEPEFMNELSIIKRELTLTTASAVGEHDVENVALRMIYEREGMES